MPNYKHLKPIEILMADDNPGDVRLAMEALKGAKVKNNVHIVHDGVDAMNFLFKKEKYKDVPTPDIILLDLNMPKKDGREVLKEVKDDKNLKRIPIVILTVSQADEDILKSYDLHANCFITKPVDFDQFINIVKTIEHFWFTIVKLPSND